TREEDSAPDRELRVVSAGSAAARSRAREDVVDGLWAAQSGRGCQGCPPGGAPRNVVNSGTPPAWSKQLRGPPSMCVVHLDAHLDWRDEVNGVHDGLSSPMRRASELPWVTAMFQVGLRGVGSACQKEIDDSAAWGGCGCAPRSCTGSAWTRCSRASPT